MITITSGTQSQEEIADALKAAGQTIVEPEAPKAEAKPKAEGKPSEQPEKPGVTSAAKTDSESGSTSEVDEKTQESQAPAGERKPNRHDFKGKLQREQEKVERLREELEAETGSKRKLQAALDEAKSRLDALQKTETPVAEDKKPEGPVRPKRPKLDDTGIDFNQESLDAALDKYDEDLATYHQAVARKTVKEEQEAAAAKAREEQQQQEAVKAQNSFVERKDEGKKSYDDWDEVFESLGPGKIEMPDAVEAAIFEADNPADLLYFFATDTLDNDGKELIRISKLNPVAQVREMTRLADRLASERSKKAVTKPAEETPKPAEKAAEKATEKPVEEKPEVPARRKPAEPVEEPLAPVGSRTSGAQDTLEKAVARGDMKAYWALRSREQAIKQGGGI